MADALRLTLRQERPLRVTACLERFEDEPKAMHRKVGNESSRTHGIGLTLKVERDCDWAWCEVVGTGTWEIVVRAVRTPV